MNIYNDIDQIIEKLDSISEMLNVASKSDATVKQAISKLSEISLYLADLQTSLEK